MQPFYLNCTPGKCFALYIPPSGDICQGAILHAPAFAEEMNKSRHMVASQARAFSEAGYGVLLLDYFGTGDSYGDFGEAELDIWIANLIEASTWLKQNVDTRIHLWGLRFGCLALCQLLQQEKNTHYQSLTLWQPVINGQQYMGQFLRLRLAGNMTGNAPKESAKDLVAILKQGENLEVAGYTLSGKLYQQIASLNMRHLKPATPQTVNWLEVNNSGSLFPSSQTLLNEWQLPESAVSTVSGSPFWSTQEISYAPELITTTTNQLRTGRLNQ